MTILTATMQRPAVNNQANMNRLCAVVRNEDIAIAEMLSPPPVHDLTLKAGHELLAPFVVRRVVQLNAENMPVIENDQRPAIHSLKRAGTIAPRQANNSFEKLSFKHFAAPETLRRCREIQCWH